MKYTFYILSCLMMVSISSTFAQSDEILSLEHDGETRSYRLHFPPQYTGSESLPLVFNLHGNTSNALQQELYSKFSDVSDTEGFILCHPDGMPIQGGVGNTWNVGFSGGSTADDAGFLNAIIDELHSNYNIDLTRVYSTGMSNGGYMSYKMACEFTDRIAAIASVTGSMVPSELTNCSPTRAIPIMQIHGTADPTVPYQGASWTTGIESLVDWWVATNGCMDGPFVTDIPDMDPDDGCTAERYEYTSCTNNVTVEFYKITDGGHTWPNAAIDIASSGPTNRDIDASTLIWDFFKQYQLGVNSPVSENITKNVSVDVFPNPTEDVISLETKEISMLGFSLYNMLGQKVYVHTFQNQTKYTDIPMADFPKGTYLLKVETKDGFIVEKVVKQ